MYTTKGYINAAAQESTQHAIEEVKLLSDYPTKGEVTLLLVLFFIHTYTCTIKWSITDAHHDSTANAYTTQQFHVCLEGMLIMMRMTLIIHKALTRFLAYLLLPRHIIPSPKPEN